MRPHHGGDWLGLWSQMDYSSLWNDSSLCSFSRWRLKQINDDAQTVSLSSLFQVLITRSLKKCCLKSVLTRFLFSFNQWPLVQLQDENLKKVSNWTEDKPYTILKTSTGKWPVNWPFTCPLSCSRRDKRAMKNWLTEHCNVHNGRNSPNYLKLRQWRWEEVPRMQHIIKTCNHRHLEKCLWKQKSTLSPNSK